MTGRFGLAIFLVPVFILALMGAAGLPLFIARSSEIPQPVVGLTAGATLESPDGVHVGTVAFLQAASGVLIQAEAKVSPVTAVRSLGRFSCVDPDGTVIEICEASDTPT